MNLTNQERISLLKFEKGFLALYSIRAYESKKILAHEDPEAPLNVYVSQALGVDFIKDIYDNEELRVKNKKISEEMYNKYGTWHIGDALTQIVWDYVRSHTEFNEQDVLDLDKSLDEAWQYFQDLKPKVKRTRYVAGVVRIKLEKSFNDDTYPVITEAEDYLQEVLLGGKIKKATIYLEYEVEEDER